MDHLFQIAHRLPQFLPFDVDGGIVHQQFVLAGSKALQNGLDVPLRGLIAVEIAFQPVAEWNDAEQFSPAQLALAAGIEFLDRAAQFGKIGADAAVLVHRSNRSVEEAVRHAGRRRDLLAAHVGELVDLLAEFRRIGVDGHQFGDEAIHLVIQLRSLFLRQRNEARSLFRSDARHRIGRGEFQIIRGLRRDFRFGILHIGHRHHPFVANYGIAWCVVQL